MIKGNKVWIIAESFSRNQNKLSGSTAHVQAVVLPERYHQAVVLQFCVLFSEKFSGLHRPKSAKDLKEQAVVLLIDQR